MAQLELDQVYSLRKPVPEWLKTKAEERYYAILGGKNGEYCIKNQCSPCKIYRELCINTFSSKSSKTYFSNSSKNINNCKVILENFDNLLIIQNSLYIKLCSIK